MIQGKFKASLVAMLIGCGALGCGAGAGEGVDSTELGVNAGPSGILIDGGGAGVAPFIADADFVGGSTINHANVIDVSGVIRPAPAAVYQTARVGNTTYTIPGFTPGALQLVRLHFAETFFTAPQLRTFDVSINGTKVLSAFDIFATSGAKNKAYISEFTRAADSAGNIVVQLTSIKDKALISGIEIAPVNNCSANIPGVAGHPDPSITYPTYSGFTLALAEEFNCPLDLDHDPIWTWSDGAPADGQTRFQKSAISFANGKMSITVSKTPTPAGTSYAEADATHNPAQVSSKATLSGELRTKYNNYRYGRYEMRLKGPVANPGHEADAANSGNFLSESFVFRTPRWQEWNEIDATLFANQPAKVGGNVVKALNAFGYPAGNAAPWSTGVGLPAAFKVVETHTYAFEWTPTAIKWFVDGALVQTFAGTVSVPIPTNSAKAMMNLWVFSSAAAFGDPAKNVYPFQADYEYFRFYRWNQETTYPCSPTPSCLPAADTDFSRNNPNEVN